MKKLALGLVAIFALIGTPVLAADMAVKAPPPPPPPPPFSWTGFYVGGNVGAHWTRDTISSSTFDPDGFFSTGGPAVVDSVSAGNLDSDAGFAGGLQAGYNWQFAPTWVVGIEGDFDWLGANSVSRFIPTFPEPVNTNDYEINSSKTSWLATIRPRVGYAFDRALLYVTGGVAFVNLDTSDLFAGSAGDNIVTTSSNRTLTGWTVGGGAEYAIWQNWSVKLEYLYAGFGTVSSTTNGFSGFPDSNITFSHRLSEQIARLGLNYRF